MKQSYTLTQVELGEAVIEYVQKRARLNDGDHVATVSWNLDRDDRTQDPIITARCSFEPKRRRT